MKSTSPIERVAVTGGNGQLGRYVVATLEPDYKVTVIDKKVTGEDRSTLSVDILDLSSLYRELKDQDAVIHIAAIDARIDASPEEFYHTNTLGTWNVLHAGYEQGIRRFVLCSSSSVYGLTRAHHAATPLYLPIHEAHPLRPLEAYGLSKQIGEIAGESFSRRDETSVLVLRPSYIAFETLLPRMLNEHVERNSEQQNHEMRGSKGQGWLEPLPLHRSWIAPEDAARCFRAALEAPDLRYDTFNVCADDTFINEPTLHYVESIFGSRPDIRDPSYYENNSRAGFFDNTKARQRLGWAPRYDWNTFSSPRH